MVFSSHGGKRSTHVIFGKVALFFCFPIAFELKKQSKQQLGVLLDLTAIAASKNCGQRNAHTWSKPKRGILICSIGAILTSYFYVGLTKDLFVRYKMYQKCCSNPSPLRKWPRPVSTTHAHLWKVPCGARGKPPIPSLRRRSATTVLLPSVRN